MESTFPGFEKEALKSKLWNLSDNAIKKHLITGRRRDLKLSLTANTLLTQLKKVQIYNTRQTFSIVMEESLDSQPVRKVANPNGNEPHEAILSSEEGIQVLGEVIFILDT